MPNPRDVKRQLEAEQTAAANAAEAAIDGSASDASASDADAQAADSPTADAQAVDAEVGQSAESESKPTEQPSSGSDTKSQAMSATKDGASSQPVASSEVSAPSDTTSQSPSTTTVAREAKAKPSPRRGKVDRKDDEKIRAAKRESRKRFLKRLLIVLAIVIVVVAVGGFAYVRWFLHDDAIGIMGKWQVDGSDATIEITESKIILNDEVSYDYAIDPASKTLSFTFGTLEGSGRYRLSVYGDRLSIIDGDYDFISTLVEDAPWTLGAVIDPDANPPTLGEDSMLLNRVR